jgi:DNA-binding response OmpR family regulator
MMVRRGGNGVLGGSKRILIIDDSPDVLETLGEYFLSHYGKTGYVIETVATGAEGVRAFMDARPGLVILDVDMPGMNGIEVLKIIRGADPRVPVIMLTGNTDNAVAATVLQCGAASYAPKPINFQYLEHLAALFLGEPDTSAAR